jgi:hypothetical protein
MHPRFTTSPCMKSGGVNSIPHTRIPSSSGRTVDSSIHNSGIQGCAPTLAHLRKWSPLIGWRDRQTLDPYSFLSMTLGSSRDARRAGNQQAAAATSVIVPTAVASVVASVGFTPNSIDAKSVLSANAPVSPITIPLRVSESPCFMIPASTLERVAPSAMRMPISRRRSVTMYERTP